MYQTASSRQAACPRGPQRFSWVLPCGLCPAGNVEQPHPSILYVLEPMQTQRFQWQWIHPITHVPSANGCNRWKPGQQPPVHGADVVAVPHKHQRLGPLWTHCRHCYSWHCSHWHRWRLVPWADKQLRWLSLGQGFKGIIKGAYLPFGRGQGGICVYSQCS